MLFDGDEHADFLSRENFQRHRPARDGSAALKRLEHETWGFHHRHGNGDDGASTTMHGGGGATSDSRATRAAQAIIQRSSREESSSSIAADADAADGDGDGGDGGAGAGADAGSGDTSGGFQPVRPELFAEAAEDECHENAHTEYWGDMSPGVSKQGNSNPQPTAKSCCASCKAEGQKVCNAWVWNPVTNECWLKRLSNPYQPANINPAIKFTSGALYPHQPRYVPLAAGGGGGGGGGGTGTGSGSSSSSSSPPPYCLHTMISSNGQPYINWQTRVFHATWKKVSKEPGSPLRHFTRVLHRTRDDELMTEVPTVRIDPTHPECDEGCDYSVKDRARAIAKWTQTDDAKRCSHIFMAEADYVLVRSPPPSVLLAKGHSYGFLFGYIIPWHADAMPASTEFHDVSKWGPMENVPQSGNAPQVMHGDDLRDVAPTWADLVDFGESSAVVKRIFGWVRDMYAFDFAAVRTGIKFHYPPVPFNKLMVQPPADVRLGAGCLMHYTWGPIISDKTGTELWRFDKRSLRGGEGSTHLFHVLSEQPLPPAWDPTAGFKLQAGEIVTEEGLGLMRHMVEAWNEAVRSLPMFPEGHENAESVAKARRGGG